MMGGLHKDWGWLFRVEDHRHVGVEAKSHLFPFSFLYTQDTMLSKGGKRNGGSARELGDCIPDVYNETAEQNR